MTHQTPVPSPSSEEDGTGVSCIKERTVRDFKTVLADKKREQDEYDHEEFLKEKDELMGTYWLEDLYES